MYFKLFRYIFLRLSQTFLCSFLIAEVFPILEAGIIKMVFLFIYIQQFYESSVFRYFSVFWYFIASLDFSEDVILSADLTVTPYNTLCFTVYFQVRKFIYIPQKFNPFSFILIYVLSWNVKQEKKIFCSVVKTSKTYLAHRFSFLSK